MNDPALPHAKIVARRSLARRQKGARNFFKRKSIVTRTRESKEIQAFPILKTKGFRGQTARAQENPNRVARTERRARRSGGAKPTPSQCKAV
jgi:hypothetical protein